MPFFLMVPEATPALAQPEVIATIPGLIAATASAYDPVHERMYVVGGNNVYIIDVNTNMQTPDSPIFIDGSHMVGIAYDSYDERMYITDSETNKVYVIDTPHTLGEPIVMGGSAFRTSGIAYNPDNNRLYVTGGNPSQDTGVVKTINPDTNQVSDTIALTEGYGKAFGIAYDSDHMRMYVNRIGSVFGPVVNPIVDIIDTTTNTLDNAHGPVEVGKQPFSGIAYDYVHQAMYVGNGGEGSTSVIDTTETPNEVIDTISSTGYRGIGFDPVNLQMYITNSRQNLEPGFVNVVDTNTNSKVPPIINVGPAPEQVTYEPLNGRMYVANRLGNSVTVIQTPQEDPATAIEDTIIDVRDLEGVGIVTKIVLISQLRFALVFVDDGDDVLACGAKNAFIATVDKFENSERLTAEQADELRQQAEAIGDAIGCIFSTAQEADTMEAASEVVEELTLSPNPSSQSSDIINAPSVMSLRN